MQFADVVVPDAAEGFTAWRDKYWDPWIQNPLTILLIIVIAMAVRAVLVRMMNRVVARVTSTGNHDRPAERRRSMVDGGLLASERRRQRAETMAGVLRSIVSVAIFGVAFVMVLGEVGLNLAPILASAGVLGVALGFGAQNLVKDFLAGIFIIMEDWYGVGDVIDAGQANGTVEEVGLRITRLRDVDGVVWYVRNGELLRVGNKSQGWARAVVDIPVAYSEDLARVRELIQRVADEMAAESPWDEMILESPDVAGVESINGESVTIRVLLRTLPTQQLDVARELRARLKTIFDKEGIKVSATAAAPAAAPAVPSHTRLV